MPSPCRRNIISYLCQHHHYLCPAEMEEQINWWCVRRDYLDYQAQRGGTIRTIGTQSVGCFLCLLHNHHGRVQLYNQPCSTTWKHESAYFDPFNIYCLMASACTSYQILKQALYKSTFVCDHVDGGGEGQCIIVEFISSPTIAFADSQMHIYCTKHDMYQLWLCKRVECVSLPSRE